MRSRRSRSSSGRHPLMAAAGVVIAVLGGSLTLALWLPYIPVIREAHPLIGQPGSAAPQARWPGADESGIQAGPQTTRTARGDPEEAFSRHTETAALLRADTATLLDATAKGAVHQVVTSATAVLSDLLRLTLDIAGLPTSVALPVVPLPARQPPSYG